MISFSEKDRIRADSPVDSRTQPSSWLSWFLVATLTAAVTGVSSYQSIRQYQELRSGWSWDLAYYNQWFWALTQGDQDAHNPTDLRVWSGGAVRLEDELPGSHPAGARAALPVGSRSAHANLDSKRDVLVGDPGGLYACSLGNAVGGRCALGGRARPPDAAVLAARLERLS